MELIPSIDLRRGKVVRLEQGDDARTTVYPVDPLRQLESFADAGIERVHLVDLDAAFGEAAQVELLRRLCNAGAVKKLQLGGGLRSAGDVERALGWGFERVVLGSMVVRDPEGFATLANCARGPGGSRARLPRWLRSDQRLVGPFTPSMEERCGSPPRPALPGGPGDRRRARRPARRAESRAGGRRRLGERDSGDRLRGRFCRCRTSSTPPGRRGWAQRSSAGLSTKGRSSWSRR